MIKNACLKKDRGISRVLVQFEALMSHFTPGFSFAEPFQRFIDFSVDEESKPLKLLQNYSPPLLTGLKAGC
jgi:hypothetical protein